MKEIIISPKRQKAEIYWLIACLCSAILINIFSIAFYQTAWKELYTQLLWVAIITCVLYAVSIGIRVCIYLIKKYIVRK